MTHELLAADVLKSCRYAAAQIVGPDHADDVVQVFALRVVSGKVPPAERAQPRTFAVGIVKRLALNYRRDNFGRQFVDIADHEPAAPSPRTSTAERLAVVYRTITPAQRRVVESFHKHGSYPAVSAELGIPVSTIKSHMRRIRQSVSV